MVNKITKIKLSNNHLIRLFISAPLLLRTLLIRDNGRVDDGRVVLVVDVFIASMDVHASSALTWPPPAPVSPCVATVVMPVAVIVAIIVAPVHVVIPPTPQSVVVVIVGEVAHD